MQDGLDPDDYWRRIVEVHLCTKDLLLRAENEDIDGELITFLQPIREHRDAHEHITRVKAIELGLGKLPEGLTLQQYIERNLQSALGHECRAFFDLADMHYTIIHKKIRILLEPYSNSCIAEVLPQYYSKMRPQLEQLGEEVKELRAEKDVAKIASSNEYVARYMDVIDKLGEFVKKTSESVPVLLEFSIKENRADQRKLLRSVLLIIFGAVVGMFLTFIFLRQ